MTRVALVAALTLSLVPPTGAAVLAASAIGGGGTEGGPRPAWVDPDRIEPFTVVAPPSECASLAPLFGRGVRLNRAVIRAELASKRPLPALRARAVRLDDDLARWQRQHVDAERPLRRMGSALRVQLAATRSLVARPTERGLESFNRGVASVNEARSGLRGYC